MFTTCSPHSPHVHNMFTTCSPYVHQMFTTCSRHVHDMLTTCSWKITIDASWTVIVLFFNGKKIKKKSEKKIFFLFGKPYCYLQTFFLYKKMLYLTMPESLGWPKKCKKKFVSIKAKKCWPEKGLFLKVITQRKPKSMDCFTKKNYKYWVFSTSLDKWGGGYKAPHPSWDFSLAKGPGGGPGPCAFKSIHLLPWN